MLRGAVRASTTRWATLATVRSADSARQAWNEETTVTHEDAPD
jgi:hypothetical protein